jgi:hypothetical protein
MINCTCAMNGPATCPHHRAYTGTSLPIGWYVAGEQPEAADGDGGRSYASAVAHQQSRAARNLPAASGD